MFAEKQFAVYYCPGADLLANWPLRYAPTMRFLLQQILCVVCVCGCILYTVLFPGKQLELVTLSWVKKAKLICRGIMYYSI